MRDLHPAEPNLAFEALLARDSSSIPKLKTPPKTRAPGFPERGLMSHFCDTTKSFILGNLRILLPVFWTGA
jgi:hypothetical protein